MVEPAKLQNVDCSDYPREVRDNVERFRVGHLRGQAPASGEWPSSPPQPIHGRHGLGREGRHLLMLKMLIGKGDTKGKTARIYVDPPMDYKMEFMTCILPYRFLH